MAHFNRVILAGHLVRDVELRTTQNNTPFANITLAINEKRPNGKGAWIDELTFVEITLWGNDASFLSKYAAKGTSLLIEGRLKLDSWESDGQKKSKMKVVSEQLRILSSGVRKQENENPYAPQSEEYDNADEIVPF